jgi:hypothetical protein
LSVLPKSGNTLRVDIYALYFLSPPSADSPYRLCCNLIRWLKEDSDYAGPYEGRSRAQSFRAAADRFAKAAGGARRVSPKRFATDHSRRTILIERCGAIQPTFAVIPHRVRILSNQRRDTESITELCDLRAIDIT